MSINRLLGLERIESSTTDLPTLSASGFMACPLPLQPSASAGAPLLPNVYQLALEQAREALRASRWQRCYAVSCN
jgi:hypothetical protein